MGFDELDGDGFTETVEIERFSRGEVGDAGDGLSRAGEIGAAPSDESLFLFDGSMTGRALMAENVWKVIGGGIGGAL